jgi:hypothetical protein
MTRLAAAVGDPASLVERLRAAEVKINAWMRSA